jgi:hypothetical protein
VEALHHHADLQAHRHYRGIGVDHDEPNQHHSTQPQLQQERGAESSLTMVSLEDGAALLTSDYELPRLDRSKLPSRAYVDWVRVWQR